ncbi:hypothetical protein ACLKA6_015722 [Drosophila palustris]
MFVVLFGLLLFSLANGLPFGLNRAQGVQVYTISPTGELQVGSSQADLLFSGLNHTGHWNSTIGNQDQVKPVRTFFRNLFRRVQRDPIVINLNQLGRDFDDTILPLEEPEIFLPVFIRNYEEMELPIYEDQLGSYRIF